MRGEDSRHEGDVMAQAAKSFGDKGKSGVKPKNHEPSRIRSTSRWQKVRELKKKLNPLCEDPFGTHKAVGIAVAQQGSHHRIGIEVRPDLAYDMDNLMSLCTACHARLEADAKYKGIPT